MRLIALASLATEISAGGGIGFIGAGSDASNLDSILEEVKDLQKQKPSLQDDTGDDVLPVGVGFLAWAGKKLSGQALPIIEKYRPAAVWLFAPNENEELVYWTDEVRGRTGGRTSVWIQIGTVANAIEVVSTCKPDVLVVQGSDAGGHGLAKSAGLITLLPEVIDAVDCFCLDNKVRRPHMIAAGGIMDGRGAAAALALGAEGVALGTRYLATPEANIAQGYRDAVVRASDGGVTTARGKLYDTLRGTTGWPEHYNGRGVLNDSWNDHMNGMSIEENRRLHDEALKQGDDGWGSNARLTTYAGTGVGLVKAVHGAERVTRELREAARDVIQKLNRIN